MVSPALVGVGSAQPAHRFGNKPEEQVMECGGKREGLGDLSPVPVSGSSSDGQCLTPSYWECGPGLLFLLTEQIPLKSLMVHFNRVTFLKM